MSNISESPLVYAFNAMCVMACLASIIFTAMQPGIESSLVAVVAGTAGSIAGSIVTIMVKSAGAQEESAEVMLSELLKQAIENSNPNEEINVIDGHVTISRGNSKFNVQNTETDEESVVDDDGYEYVIVEDDKDEVS